MLTSLSLPQFRLPPSRRPPASFRR